jgi:hypothetical protein
MYKANCDKPDGTKLYAGHKMNTNVFSGSTFYLGCIKLSLPLQQPVFEKVTLFIFIKFVTFIDF